MIPTQFNLLGHTILVKIDNEYCEKHDCMGRFIAVENTIIVSDKYKVNGRWKAYKKSVVEHTFHHELVHCILYYTGNEKLWLDEQLVDSIGGLYHQYETSRK